MRHDHEKTPMDDMNIIDDIPPTMKPTSVFYTTFIYSGRLLVRVERVPKIAELEQLEGLIDYEQERGSMILRVK